MSDLKNRNLIFVKGFLFILLGILASFLLLLRVPSVAVAVLHCIAIWAFCRFYYFAFYVIQHYVDSGYRFAGLYSFLRYVVQSRTNPVSRDNA